MSARALANFFITSGGTQPHHREQKRQSAQFWLGHDKL
jgi:hypothetical protein